MAFQRSVSDFVRKGQAAMRTGVLAETTIQGRIINIADMTEYDVGDTWLGYLVNDKDFSAAPRGAITSGTEVYYIDLNEAKGAEILVIDSGAGIAVGGLCQVTTTGEFVLFAYANATAETDLMRDCLGVAMAAIGANVSGFMKVR